jgi:lincosamide nucleotidyltransferase A/C/D/E
VTYRLTGEQVVALLDRLAPSARWLWIGGGWGVDALVGRETRPHADLDLLVDADSLPAVLDLLAADGFVPTEDWLPVRIEVAHPDGRRVDLHPARPRPDGSAVQAGLDGTEFHYPAGCTTTGTVAGREVTCLTATQQLTFRQGFTWRPVDHHDVALLQAHLDAAPG